jgi:basic membrane lipoprotein Med (substrate-binding protein (PBP1-ABC) superfamily)
MKGRIKMVLKSRKLTFLTAMILIVSLLMAGCAAPAPAPSAPATAEPTQAAEPAKVVLKAAMLLSGPINDGGWNTDAYKGLLKLKDMGYEIVYTENVQQADQESIVRGYAKQGFNLIVGHGFEYGDTLAKAWSHNTPAPNTARDASGNSPIFSTAPAERRMKEAFPQRLFAPASPFKSPCLLLPIHS